jgi:double-stranded uracil-DNA glycosylase
MSTRSSPGSSAAPERARAFTPVAGPGTRLLVLGSLPGAASLRAGQYYAHPQNGFWRLIGAAIGRDIAALPYPDRLAALAAAGVGLWDVVASAERPGSADAAIRNPEHADLAGLVAGLPALRAVGFNGGTAARLGRRRLGARAGGLALVDLPSSSPAYAAMPFEAKRAAWAGLAAFLRDGRCDPPGTC